MTFGSTRVGKFSLRVKSNLSTFGNYQIDEPKNLSRSVERLETTYRRRGKHNGLSD